MSRRKEAPDWFGCGKTITQESWDGFLKARAEYYAKKDRMRTPQEIEAEIAALKALKPVGPFKDKTAGIIAAAIEELLNGVDDTADEFEEMPENEQEMVWHARDWKDGVSSSKPSEDWGQLVKQ